MGLALGLGRVLIPGSCFGLYDFGVAIEESGGRCIHFSGWLGYVDRSLTEGPGN